MKITTEEPIDPRAAPVNWIGGPLKEVPAAGAKSPMREVARERGWLIITEGR